jgi:hypothetical protein
MRGWRSAAAHVDALRSHPGIRLDGADVDARVLDDAAIEDEAAALDVELAAVGGVLAILDRKLAGAGGDIVGSRYARRCCQ